MDWESRRSTHVVVGLRFGCGGGGGGGRSERRGRRSEHRAGVEQRAAGRARVVNCNTHRTHSSFSSPPGVAFLPVMDTGSISSARDAGIRNEGNVLLVSRHTFHPNTFVQRVDSFNNETVVQ